MGAPCGQRPRMPGNVLQRTVRSPRRRTLQPRIATAPRGKAPDSSVRHSEPLPPPAPQAKASRPVCVVSPTQAATPQPLRSSPPRLRASNLYASTDGAASKKASLTTGPHFLQLCGQTPKPPHQVQARASGSVIGKNAQESPRPGFSGRMLPQPPAGGRGYGPHGDFFFTSNQPPTWKRQKMGPKACVSCFPKRQKSGSRGPLSFAATVGRDRPPGRTPTRTPGSPRLHPPRATHSRDLSGPERDWSLKPLRRSTPAPLLS